MGKLNEIQEQTTQSWGDNSFTTKITNDTVEFDSARDSFTFKDEVNVPSLAINGQATQPFTSEEKTKLSQVTTPMNMAGRVDSASELPTEDVQVGDVYLVGLSGSDTFEEYVCVETSGSPATPVWENLGHVKVQDDWNQNNSNADDFIKNKPAIKAGQGVNSIIEGELTQNSSTGKYSHAEGGGLYGGVTASGDYSHAEGTYTKAIGANSHAEGNGTSASGEGSHAEGNQTTASGSFSHAEGNLTKASGVFSHAEGGQTTASAFASHAEGERSTASWALAHAEGNHTTASEYAAHAEGNETVASGNSSHAEGGYTTASKFASHAEGSNTTASGEQSHAEGEYTTASGNSSHAEGSNTTATGSSSHAEGKGTIANNKCQHVFGEYNGVDPSSALSSARGTYIEIVGNGTTATNRSNARTLDWSGNETLAGNLTIGGTITANNGVKTTKITIAGINPADEYMYSEIIDASSDVALTRVLASISSTKTDGYVEILYKVTTGVTCSAYIDSTDVALTADGAWHKLEQGCNPDHGVEIHVNNSAPVTDATLEVISKVYYI